MSQNGQTHFKNLAGFAARFVKCVWPFWDIMHLRVKIIFCFKTYSEYQAKKEHCILKQLRCTYSKSTIETSEKDVKYVSS